MLYGLPKSIRVNGTEWAIRSDFRDILNIIVAMGDPNLSKEEKIYVCLYVFYEDFMDMDEADYEEALRQAFKFIDYGNSSDRPNTIKRLVDFEQDESMIIPAINKVAGTEIRGLEYLHWWTFVGYYMEIGECVYSQVLNIRIKKAKGKPLEKWEQEFFNENKSICVIEDKLSDEELEEKERLNKMLE